MHIKYKGSHVISSFVILASRDMKTVCEIYIYCEYTFDILLIRNWDLYPLSLNLGDLCGCCA